MQIIIIYVLYHVVLHGMIVGTRLIKGEVKMTSIDLAEKLILDRIHKTTPRLRNTLADLIDGLPLKEVAERNGVEYSSVRNLKSRYKVALKEVIDGKD